MTEEPNRPVCYLDTNVFIAAFESNSEPASQLASLFSTFRARPEAAVTSELTIAELLAPSSVSPLTESKTRLYSDLLLWSDFIRLKPVTLDVLLATVELRRNVPHKLRLPDAIHMATASKSRCSFVMSDDQDFRSLPLGMTWVRPDADGITTVLKALDA